MEAVDGRTEAARRIMRGEPNKRDMRNDRLNNRSMEKKTRNRSELREPADVFDCWSMDCRECCYYGGEKTGCQHPERYLNPEQT